VSGAAFLIRRSVLEEIGPFDVDFFAYLEETDLSLRAMLAGYTCLYVSTSQLYHKYAFKFSERKCFDIEKNRYYMLAKEFHLRTLLLISPILLFTDLLVWGYMLMKGWPYMRRKRLSYIWLWRNSGKIREPPIPPQRVTRVPDRSMQQKLVPQLYFHQMVQSNQGKPLQVLTTPVLSALS